MKRKGAHNDFSRYLLEPGPGQDFVSFSDFIRRTAVVLERALPESAWSAVDGLHYQRSQGYAKSLSFNQVDYLIDRWGRFHCDAIIRFDRLEDDFRSVLRRFHANADTNWLGRMNADPTPGDWRAQYARTEDRDWVGRLYKRDIRRFGFTFEDAS
jgi:hypothetical protein